MTVHEAWVRQTPCRRHHLHPCDCEPIMKIEEWVLRNDALDILGVVQRFEEGGPFYGVGVSGRTGPMADRLSCQARVEAMLEGAA